MNEILNIRRFRLLFKKLLFEQPLQTFGLLGIALIGTLLIYQPYSLRGINYSQAEQVLHFALFLGGGSLTFFMFSHFSDNAKGYSYLLMPSSYFEKWLCGFIVVCVLFLGIYLTFFRIVDSTYVNAFHKELANAKELSPQTARGFMREVQVLYYDSEEFKRSLALFFIMTGATAVGSLYFNKNAFVKIFIGVIAVVWIYTFMNNRINNYFFTGVHIGTSFFGRVYIEESTVTLSKAQWDIVDILFYYCLPTALWLIALIRLREKEI
jgi:hypothetical protein